MSSDWQKKVVEILRTDTSDLKELARIAGADYKTFYRGANFRSADLSGQDLHEFDLRGANLASATLNTDLGSDNIARLREALASLSGGNHASQWAKAQNNLGTALQNQGLRTDGAAGTQLLAEAVTAYRDALTIYTRDDHPLDWATTQNNLGNALQDQGTRTDGAAGTQLLADAVTAYRDALNIRTRDDHPVQWATTQNNLGDAEMAIAAHDTTKDPRPHLEAALSHVDAALTVFDPEHMSYHFETTTRLRDDIKAKLAALD